MELLLGAGVSIGTVVPVLSRAPRPGHDVGAAAERRMHQVVQQLKAVGCQASGIISDHDMLEAVRAESRAHDYDQVILATSRRDGPLGGSPAAPGPGAPAAVAVQAAGDRGPLGQAAASRGAKSVLAARRAG